MKPAKKLRRDGGQKAGRTDVRQPAKVKRTISLSPESSRRLDIHATGEDCDVSEVVEALIQDGCRKWQLAHVGGPRPRDGGPAETAASPVKMASCELAQPGDNGVE